MSKLKSIQDTYTLYNDVEIPCVGYGTFQTPEGKDTVNGVKAAIEAGYRHIDTAAVYGNEKSVGQGILESGVPREEIFVTTKVWNSDQGFESTLQAFEKSRKKLGMEYIDLYLIHWPRTKQAPDEWRRLNRETWQAMEKLYTQGYVKAIGVSNFEPQHINSLMEMSLVKPMVNQIELHPGWLQQETVDYCRDHQIQVEAWGPFSRGKLFKSGELDELAKKYGKSVAQICLRWHLQNGFLPLPKSVTPSRIKENTEFFDFELSQDEMDYISGIKDTGTGRVPHEVLH